MDIEIKQIREKARKLSSTYKVEYSELENELASALKSEIDWELATNILVSSGWHRVQINNISEDVEKWVHSNCVDEYRCNGYSWAFKNERDAVMFSMRWV